MASQDPVARSADPAPPETGSARIGVIEAVQGPVVDIVCERLPPLDWGLFVRDGDERVTLEVPASSTSGASAPLRFTEPPACGAG